MKNLPIVLSLLVFIFVSTSTFAQRSISGQGGTTTKTLQLNKIHSIGLGVSAYVYISKGAQQSIKIEGQSNIIDLINQEVNNGSWNIKFDQKVRNYDKLKIYISLKDLQSLAIGGSGSIILESAFNGLDKLDVAIGGNGKIDLQGDAKELSISIGGNGSVNATEMKVTECSVSIAGNGECEVDVDDNLSVSIAGMGNVSYKGSPRISQSIAGFGKVRRMK